MCNSSLHTFGSLLVLEVDRLGWEPPSVVYYRQLEHLCRHLSAIKGDPLHSKLQQTQWQYQQLRQQTSSLNITLHQLVRDDSIMSVQSDYTTSIVRLYYDNSVTMLNRSVNIPCIFTLHLCRSGPDININSKKVVTNRL